MVLNEIVKDFLSSSTQSKEKESSVVHKDNIISDLGNSEMDAHSGSFFDESDSQLFGNYSVSDIILKQREKIMKYRQLAMTPDVAEALDEIVNEIIFIYDDRFPIKIDINEENDKLVTAISEKFDKVLRLLDIKRNMFSLVRNGYIDGQIVLHTSYDTKKIKSGIKSIRLVEPSLLYFDKRDNLYRYYNNSSGYAQTSSVLKEKTYSREEICIEDFGIKDGDINLGYLEYALKPANILKTLEDLLIPLRFSRSISRRVFNVDIGGLPGKRGAEVMRDYQGRFKYKKFYNNETGEVSNQQHITSMVEDYWFANRSGGKGTTVDVLDESGNLGELDDILYFSKKLYKALKIPSSRISGNQDADKDFGYDETRTSKEDMKFFMFISRIRQVYSSLFKEVLKRECISSGILSVDEWDEKEPQINIFFTNENKFIEKMKLDNFMSKLDIYSSAQEYQGKLFSVGTILKDIFRMNEDEIKEEFKKIEDESKDPLFAKFYNKEEGDW